MGYIIIDKITGEYKSTMIFPTRVDAESAEMTYSRLNLRDDNRVIVPLPTPEELVREWELGQNGNNKKFSNADDLYIYLKMGGKITNESWYAGVESGNVKCVRYDQQSGYYQNENYEVIHDIIHLLYIEFSLSDWETYV